MTGAEATLLAVMASCHDHPQRAGMLLADLLGVRNAGGTLATAQSVAAAFSDLGLPL